MSLSTMIVLVEGKGEADRYRVDQLDNLNKINILVMVKRANQHSTSLLPSNLPKKTQHT